MNQKLIKDAVESILSKLGITVDGITVSDVGGNTVFAIQTPDSGVLIGSHGETLSALNHVVKKMFESTIPREEHYVIDVNGYHTRKVQSLEDQARLVAERARTFRYDVELSPMSAYERMIIHSTLKDMPDIETMSHGEGKLRHIVVRYKEPGTGAPVQE